MKVYAVVEGITNYSYTYFNKKEDAVKLFNELKSKYEKESSEKKLPITNWNDHYFTMSYPGTDYELTVRIEEKEVDSVPADNFKV